MVPVPAATTLGSANYPVQGDTLAVPKLRASMKGDHQDHIHLSLPGGGGQLTLPGGGVQLTCPSGVDVKVGLSVWASDFRSTCV